MKQELDAQERELARLRRHTEAAAVRARLEARQKLIMHEPAQPPPQTGLALSQPAGSPHSVPNCAYSTFAPTPNPVTNRMSNRSSTSKNAISPNSRGSPVSSTVSAAIAAVLRNASSVNGSSIVHDSSLVNGSSRDAQFAPAPPRPSLPLPLALWEGSFSQGPEQEVQLAYRDALSQSYSCAYSDASLHTLYGNPTLPNASCADSTQGAPAYLTTARTSASHGCSHAYLPTPASTQTNQRVERASPTLHLAGTLLPAAVVSTICAHLDVRSGARFAQTCVSARDALSADAHFYHRLSRARRDHMEEMALRLREAEDLGVRALESFKTADYIGAESLFRKALERRQFLRPRDLGQEVVIMNNLATTLDRLGSPREAEIIYLRAISLAEGALSPNDARLRHVRTKLAALQERLFSFPGLRPQCAAEAVALSHLSSMHG